MRDKFKKFGGEKIEDIIEYLKEYVKEEPNVTISVGCDSVQKRKKTLYAITIMLYSKNIKNGAHVIFTRFNLDKIRNHYDRLSKESEFSLEVANMIHDELSPFFVRTDIDELERKKYKFHIGKCQDMYDHVPSYNEESFIKNLSLTEEENLVEYKLVDIHVDYNPHEGIIDKRGVAKNKSNLSYKTNVPWIKSLGYRVFSKNISYAASSAADLLLQD